MTADLNRVEKKLDAMRADLALLKKRITDVDLVMTDDDTRSLRDAESDLKAGRAKRLV